MRGTFFFLLAAATAWAENLYVTQAGAGSGNGSSVANAFSAAAFNTAGNWGVGAGKISAGDTVYLSGTFTTRLTVLGSGTSTSARITLTDTAALPATLVGILSSGYDYIAVIGLEFTQTSSANNYPAIRMDSGCDGWLIEGNNIHNTYGGGVDLHTSKCNNTIIRYNTFDRITWVGLGASGGNTITITGDNVLCEYNTIGSSLDRVYIGIGDKIVVRNNHYTETNVDEYTATTVYPFHVDGFQGATASGAPATNNHQIMIERNFSVDQLEPSGRNSHGFIYQDYFTIPDARWFIDRFNVLVRPSGGSHIFQQLLEFYNYNNTYIAINNDYAASSSAIYWGGGSVIAPDVSTWINNTWSLSPKLSTTAGGIFDTSSTKFPTNFSSGYQHSWNSASTGGLLPVVGTNLGHVDPLFTNSATDDYTLQSGSPLKTAGGPLTLANGAGVATTTLIVDSAVQLFDGWSTGADADWIKIGSGAYVQISAIDYGTNTVTLSDPRSWSDNDTVIVKGMEDIGALPYSYVATPTVTNTTATASPTALMATTSTTEAVRMVEFLIDGLPVGIAYYDGTGTFSYTNTPSGAKTLEARAYNYWASQTLTVSSYLLINQDPSGLSATGVSPSQINLSWTDNSAGADTFSIEQSPNGTTGWAEVATTGAGVVTKSITGLAASTTYYYRVRAVNSGIYSGYTSNANATTLGSTPYAPTLRNPSALSAGI